MVFIGLNKGCTIVWKNFWTLSGVTYYEHPTKNHRDIMTKLISNELSVYWDEYSDPTFNNFTASSLFIFHWKQTSLINADLNKRQGYMHL